MRKSMILVIAALLPQLTVAHEGHDKTPGAKSAPHGGLVSGTSKVDLELVNSEGGIKIYPFDSEMKPIALDKLTIEGTVTFPRKSKGEKVSFTKDSNAFTAKVDTKGAYRYALDLAVTYMGKKEKVKFNVEPQ